MGGVLDSILAARREQTEQAKRRHPESELRQRWHDRQLAGAGDSGESSGRQRFIGSLRQHAPLAILAEVKRRSPSAGAIRPELNLADQAQAYTQAGAAAISVLTEAAHFAGASDDLLTVRRSSPLPVLRKDFLTEPYHLYESACLGAAAVLLIVRILGKGQLGELISLTAELGLAALVEVHDEAELARALEVGATIIGINNRNLDNLHTDRQTVRRLARLIPPQADRLVIAESGYHRAEEVAGLPAVGVDAVLIGEALLRADDPGACLRQFRQAVPRLSDPLLATPRHVGLGPLRPAAAAAPPPRPAPARTAPAQPAPATVRVKICGLRDLQSASAAVAAGADALGFVFHPASRRALPLDAARSLFAALRQHKRFRPTPPTESVEWMARPAPASCDEDGKELPLLVGVFVGTPLETIAQHVRLLGLDVVQLHGEANLARCALLRDQLDAAGLTRTQIWWGWPVATVEQAAEQAATIAPQLGSSPPIRAILLDRVGAAPGGNGQPFDPSSIARLGYLRQHFPRLQWGIAGGLRPETVAATIAAAVPDFVDVASGVEQDGRQDPGLIRRFVEQARSAFSALSTCATPKREVIS